jgi:hypothetical protein
MAHPPKSKDTEQSASAAGAIEFGGGQEPSKEKAGQGTQKIIFVGGDAVKGDQVQISGSSYITGDVNAGGGTFIGRDLISAAGLSPAAVERLFAPLYTAVAQSEALGPADKDDLHAELHEVELEAGRGQAANEMVLARRLRNCHRVSPEVTRLALAVLADPVAGFGDPALKAVEIIRAKLEPPSA